MRAALKGLLKSQGWARLREVLADHATQRNTLMNHSLGEDFALRLAQARGEILGIKHCVELPETLVEELDTLIAEAEEHEDDPNDAQADEPPAGA